MKFNVKNSVERMEKAINQKDEKEYYIYYGNCDGKSTQWICKTEWNYNINVNCLNGDLIYSDDNDEQIHVFEDEEIIPTMSMMESIDEKLKRFEKSDLCLYNDLFNRQIAECTCGGYPNSCDCTLYDVDSSDDY